MVINKESTYFIPMYPKHTILGISFTCTTDELVWTECKIVERRYKLEENYKIEVEALNPVFGTTNFYVNDFKSMLSENYIIEKTRKTQHVEFFDYIEPLTDTVVIVHNNCSVVVD